MNRKPFKLTHFMRFHSLSMCLLSIYMFSKIVYERHKYQYSYACQAVDYSQEGYEMAKVIYVFFFSKLLEFSDTFIIILRKQDRQLSFLHCYHHISVFALWWIGANYVPGGESAKSSALNSFVHIWMYGYYFMKACGIRDIWWKKYLTQLQLTQFVWNMGDAVYGIYMKHSGRHTCNFPEWMIWAMIGYMVSLVALFLNFYIRAYSKGKREKKLQNGVHLNGHSSGVKKVN